jgi:hypothetical protein
MAGIKIEEEKNIETIWLKTQLQQICSLLYKVWCGIISRRQLL